MNYAQFFSLCADPFTSPLLERQASVLQRLSDGLSAGYPVPDFRTLVELLQLGALKASESPLFVPIYASLLSSLGKPYIRSRASEEREIEATEALCDLLRVVCDALTFSSSPAAAQQGSKGAFTTTVGGSGSSSSSVALAAAEALISFLGAAGWDANRSSVNAASGTRGGSGSSSSSDATSAWTWHGTLLGACGGIEAIVSAVRQCALSYSPPPSMGSTGANKGTATLAVTGALQTAARAPELLVALLRITRDCSERAYLVGALAETGIVRVCLTLIAACGGNTRDPILPLCLETLLNLVDSAAASSGGDAAGGSIARELGTEESLTTLGSLLSRLVASPAVSAADKDLRNDVIALFASLVQRPETLQTRAMPSILQFLVLLISGSALPFSCLLLSKGDVAACAEAAQLGNGGGGGGESAFARGRGGGGGGGGGRGGGRSYSPTSSSSPSLSPTASSPSAPLPSSSSFSSTSGVRVSSASSSNTASSPPLPLSQHRGSREGEAWKGTGGVKSMGASRETLSRRRDEGAASRGMEDEGTISSSNYASWTEADLELRLLILGVFATLLQQDPRWVCSGGGGGSGRVAYRKETSEEEEVDEEVVGFSHASGKPTSLSSSSSSGALSSALRPSPRSIFTPFNIGNAASSTSSSSSPAASSCLQALVQADLPGALLRMVQLFGGGGEELKKLHLVAPPSPRLCQSLQVQCLGLLAQLAPFCISEIVELEGPARLCRVFRRVASAATAVTSSSAPSAASSSVKTSAGAASAESSLRLASSILHTLAAFCNAGMLHPLDLPTLGRFVNTAVNTAGTAGGLSPAFLKQQQQQQQQQDSSNASSSLSMTSSPRGAPPTENALERSRGRLASLYGSTSVLRIIGGEGGLHQTCVLASQLEDSSSSPSSSSSSSSSGIPSEEDGGVSDRHRFVALASDVFSPPLPALGTAPWRQQLGGEEGGTGSSPEQQAAAPLTNLHYVTGEGRRGGLSSLPTVPTTQDYSSVYEALLAQARVGAHMAYLDLARANFAGALEDVIREAASRASLPPAGSALGSLYEAALQLVVAAVGASQRAQSYLSETGPRSSSARLAGESHASSPSEARRGGGHVVAVTYFHGAFFAAKQRAFHESEGTQGAKYSGSSSSSSDKNDTNPLFGPTMVLHLTALLKQYAAGMRSRSLVPAEAGTQGSNAYLYISSCLAALHLVMSDIDGGASGKAHQQPQQEREQEQEQQHPSLISSPGQASLAFCSLDGVSALLDILYAAPLPQLVAPALSVLLGAIDYGRREGGENMALLGLQAWRAHDDVQCDVERLLLQCWIAEEKRAGGGLTPLLPRLASPSSPPPPSSSSSSSSSSFSSSSALPPLPPSSHESAAFRTLREALRIGRELKSSGEAEDDAAAEGRLPAAAAASAAAISNAGQAPPPPALAGKARQDGFHPGTAAHSSSQAASLLTTPALSLSPSSTMTAAASLLLHNQVSSRLALLARDPGGYVYNLHIAAQDVRPRLFAALVSLGALAGSSTQQQADGEPSMLPSWGERGEQRGLQTAPPPPSSAASLAGSRATAQGQAILPPSLAEAMEAARIYPLTVLQRVLGAAKERMHTRATAAAAASATTTTTTASGTYQSPASLNPHHPSPFDENDEEQCNKLLSVLDAAHAASRQAIERHRKAHEDAIEASQAYLFKTLVLSNQDMAIASARSPRPDGGSKGAGGDATLSNTSTLPSSSSSASSSTSSLLSIPSSPSTRTASYKSNTLSSSRMGPTSPINQRIITMSERKEILAQKGAMLARSFEGYRAFGDKTVIRPQSAREDAETR